MALPWAASCLPLRGGKAPIITNSWYYSPPTSPETMTAASMLGTSSEPALTLCAFECPGRRISFSASHRNMGPQNGLAHQAHGLSHSGLDHLWCLPEKPHVRLRGRPQFHLDVVLPLALPVIPGDFGFHLQPAGSPPRRLPKMMSSSTEPSTYPVALTALSGALPFCGSSGLFVRFLKSGRGRRCGTTNLQD